MGNIVTEMAMTKSREARIAIASAISATQTLVFAIEEAVTLNGHHLSIDQAKYILAIRAEADKVVQRAIGVNCSKETEVKMITEQFLTFQRSASKLPEIFAALLERQPDDVV